MSFKIVSFLHLYLLFLYTNRVIGLADFVSNFVAMTTKVAPLKI